MPKDKEPQVMQELKLDSEDIANLKLEMHEQRWAVRIRGTLYAFPKHVTKAEAEVIIQKAALLHQTRYN
jgi:hypothetical protein